MCLCLHVHERVRKAQFCWPLGFACAFLRMCVTQRNLQLHQAVLPLILFSALELNVPRGLATLSAV